MEGAGAEGGFGHFPPGASTIMRQTEVGGGEFMRLRDIGFFVFLSCPLSFSLPPGFSFCVPQSLVLIFFSVSPFLFFCFSLPLVLPFSVFSFPSAAFSAAEGRGVRARLGYGTLGFPDSSAALLNPVVYVRARVRC